ncbi:MAG: WD40/YVTN/BNR-like repeat-containing protein, partial [Thermoprotei archaeon]
MKKLVKAMGAILLLVVFILEAGEIGVINGVDNWEKIFSERGMIRDITIDPNSNFIYVATVGNGLWQSIDGGQTWKQVLSCHWGTFNFITICKDTIYTGGEDNAGDIFKSTDKGKTWSKLGLNKNILSFAVDSQNPQTMYAGTRFNGIFKSIDGGNTWKQMGLNNLSISALAIDPLNSSIIYAGTWKNGLFKSMDGGNTWQLLDKDLKYFYPLVSSIIIDSNKGIIYVSVSWYNEIGNSIPGKGIFKSIDGGNSWQAVNNGFTSLSIKEVIGDWNTGILYAASEKEGVFFSIDEGMHWENIGLRSFFIYGIALNSQDPRIIYAIVHVGFPQDDIVYRGRAPLYKIDTFFSKGGIITPITSYFKDSTSQTFTITSNTGYKIKDVKVDGVSVGAVSTYTFENINKDHTIEAIFEPITFVITASVSSGGSISPSGLVSVNYGSSQTFTITPNTGYKIKDVLVDNKSVGPVTAYTFTNIIENHTIQAIFEPITFIIFTSLENNGTIIPSGIITVNYGDSKTFTITPNTGYKIKDVLV